MRTFEEELVYVGDLFSELQRLEQFLWHPLHPLPWLRVRRLRRRTGDHLIDEIDCDSLFVTNVVFLRVRHPRRPSIGKIERNQTSSRKCKTACPLFRRPPFHAPSPPFNIFLVYLAQYGKSISAIWGEDLSEL